MNKRKTHYLFVINNELKHSAAGETALKNPQLRGSRAFFEPERQSALMTLVNRMVCQMKQYRETRKHDHMVGVSDDPCNPFPVMASHLAACPDRREAEQTLRELFLSPAHQRLLLTVKSQTLKRSVIWWGRKISHSWQEAFGVQPSVFAKELEARL